MRVLIVEDSKDKLARIETLLAVRLGYSMNDLNRVTTLSGFYGFVRGTPPELVILDMTFEVSDAKGASSKQDAAGLEVLQSFLSRGYNTPIIVTTQHEEFHHKGIMIKSSAELEAMLARVFPDNFVGLVKVDLASTDWEEDLVRLLRVARRRAG